LGQGKTGDYHLAESPRFFECANEEQESEETGTVLGLGNLLVFLVLELPNAESRTCRGSYEAA